MIAVQEEKNVFRSNFKQLERELDMGSSGRMRSLRKEALGLFEELGFPTVRNEDWKFTNLAALAKVPFKPASPPVAGELSLDRLEQATLPLKSAQRLVFLNGVFVPELSQIDRLPKGVMAKSLAQAIAEKPELVDTYLARQVHFRDHTFTALNTAFLRDGAFVHVPRGVVVEEPLYLVSVTSCGGEACVIHPRNLIIADESSQLTLVEYYAGLETGPSFTNAVTEVVAGPNSVIDHYKVQRESLESFHIAATYVEMARASNFSSHLVSLGGALVRNDIRSRLGAEGCVCTLNGLYLGSGRQHVDNHTEIDHAFPNCQSHELYKGILDEQAHGVFNGKIFVRQDAQKTDAKQTNQTLLLSDAAVIDTKPQLEIFADDVKCTHGATVGQLSDEAIFYLRSRGIGLAEARSLLTFAFANDVVRRIQVEPIRAQLQDVLLVRQHLPAAEEAS
jgi:Fe-S cluster assembly protein SufD